MGACFSLECLVEYKQKKDDIANCSVEGVMPKYKNTTTKQLKNTNTKCKCKNIDRRMTKLAVQLRGMKLRRGR